MITNPLSGILVVAHVLAHKSYYFLCLGNCVYVLIIQAEELTVPCLSIEFPPTYVNYHKKRESVVRQY